MPAAAHEHVNEDDGVGSEVSSDDELRELYRPPGEPALRKQIDHLDRHCRDFLAHSPFFVMGTADGAGRCDVSPKGGPPGFVKVLDDRRLAWADLAGNNRLDSFTNVLANRGVGLLFMIPGVDETLRVNGRAALGRAPALLETCAIDERIPKVAVVVTVEEAFIHCAKAYRRGSVWTPDEWPDTSDMASPACMLRDHSGYDGVPEEAVAAVLEESYADTMWKVGGHDSTSPNATSGG